MKNRIPVPKLGLFLIYRKLKSLIIHIPKIEIISHSFTEEYRGITKVQWAQRNSGHRGTAGTEEQWAQRNGGHRGTVGTEEQWAQRNCRHRGTVGTEEQWAQRNSGHRGTVGTEEL